ncbi:Mis12 protein-domain-containing protein [Phyllosticta capitalensis]|uniref:Mis12 protein-domain-containing protein n=1 Tax=Phyllosticta capitalensis TaxID=121624 RepID=UPI00312DB44C
MASAKQVETALLTEHFRYTPLTLIDQIINMINELLQHAVDAIESGLLSTSAENLGFAAAAAQRNVIPDTDGEGRPLFPEMRREIEEGVHQLETLLEAHVDRNFDKLEIYALRNVFAVPEDLVPWVRLAHYENLRLPGGGTDQTTTTTTKTSPEAAHALLRRWSETSKLQTALLEEKARNAARLRQLRGLLGVAAPPPDTTTKTEPSSSPVRGAAPAPPEDNNTAQEGGGAAACLGFLAAAPGAQALGVTTTLPASEGARKDEPLKTNTAFTLSQLPALRALLQSLRPKAAALGASSSGGDAFSQERRDYIEKQVKRLLERRGVDVKNGEGSVEGMGRRVAPDEVRGMEAVAGLLGGGNGEGAAEGANNEDRMEE